MAFGEKPSSQYEGFKQHSLFQLENDRFRRDGTDLSDDSENAIGVHSLAWAVETGVSHTVRVEVAAIRIARASVSIARVCTTACISVAAMGS